METTDPRDEQQPAVARRILMKTAAWTAPMAVAAIAAPAIAASTPEPGGSVNLTSNCTGSSTSQTQTLTIDGSSTYPTHGIWLGNVPNASAPTEARLTIYYSTAFGTLPWTRVSGGTTWSIPTVDATAPAIANFTAYTTAYSGAWTYDATNRRWRASNGLNFRAIRPGTGLCVDPVTIYSLRRITRDGQTFTLQRGPTDLA